MKHTPWEIEGPEGKPPQWVVYNQRRENVAYCHDLDEACLIASAPDLLEALERISRLSTSEPNPSPKTEGVGVGVASLAWACDIASDAIAKAKGET